jgi:hypothetical protein
MAYLERPIRRFEEIYAVSKSSLVDDGISAPGGTTMAGSTRKKTYVIPPRSVSHTTTRFGDVNFLHPEIGSHTWSGAWLPEPKMTLNAL